MSIQWLALGYNIPINPSRNRVYVWRKLKEYGAEYFRSGVAVLPRTVENLGNFSTLSKKIREMEGEATLIEMNFLDPLDEQKMIARFQHQTEQEYQKILAEAEKLMREQSPPPETNSRMKKLLRQLDRVKNRDHFMTGLTEDLEQGFGELLSTLRDTAGDFGQQLRQTMNENRKKKEPK